MALRKLAKNLAIAVLRDSPIHLIILSYCLLGSALVAMSGHFSVRPYLIVLDQRMVLYFAILPMVTLVYLAGHSICMSPKAPLTHLIARCHSLNAARFLAGMLLLTVFPIFQGTFTLVKATLPRLHHFTYDAALANLDKALHFGVDPWRITHTLLPWPQLRGLVELTYIGIWVFYVFGTVFYVCVSPHANSLRRRYLITYIFVWILIGNFAAALAMSAGPCFYGYVTGDTARFADLFAFIHAHPHSAITISQDYLWAVYVKDVMEFGTGISAFPSLHVATVTLNALFAREVSKKLGLAAWGYVGIIFFISVYTGWHYAVDGYAAICLTSLIYFAGRALSRARFGKRRAHAAFQHAILQEAC